MAYNLFDVYPPEFWVQESLLILEPAFVTAGLVHRNFEDVVAERGDTIQTRRPKLFTAKQMNRYNVTDNTMDLQDAESDNLTVELDRHYHVAFHITDRDADTSVKNLIEEFIRPAAIPLATQVDTDLLQGDGAATDANPGLLTDTTVLSGQVTDSTTSGSLDLADFAAINGKMFGQKALMDDGMLHMILGTTHYQQALSVPEFVQANTMGLNPPPIRTGFIRELYGMNIYRSQQVPAEDSTDASAQSVAFHRNAMTLVTRALSPPPRDMGVRSASLTHGGVGMRVVMTYDHEYMATLVSLDSFWGFKLLDTNLIHILRDKNSA